MGGNMIPALAERIGDVAVVVSLVPLGPEVRHGNALERAEAQRAINLKASGMSPNGPGTTVSCMPRAPESLAD